jgi:NAD(P)-dependent dehydrogenase (short-subunit alcohol dehydrogenase family)
MNAASNESFPAPGPASPVAIITGAGRGIGRATAIELARHGYRLSLASRNPDELNETMRLACGKTSGESAIAVGTDVTRPEEVDRLVSATLDRFGRIDAVINNAGAAPMRSIVQTTVAEWHLVLDTNLSAAFYLCKAAWPAFEGQRSGVVVNVSSAAARDPFPGFVAYGAAKAGLNLFGLAAAREGDKIGVRVHTVAPGAVETGMLRGLFSPDQYPAENTLDPGDIARTIVSCILGDLRHASGEVIYLHKRMS